MSSRGETERGSGPASGRSPEPYLDSVARKDARMPEAREQGEMPKDIWLFRVEAR